MVRFFEINSINFAFALIWLLIFFKYFSFFFHFPVLETQVLQYIIILRWYKMRTHIQIEKQGWFYSIQYDIARSYSRIRKSFSIRFGILLSGTHLKWLIPIKYLFFFFFKFLKTFFRFSSHCFSYSSRFFFFSFG